MKQLIRRNLPLKRKQESAQGMVEFALVLPLLLMLALGIIEVGRLMVIYASVSAGSREAGRYAAATGNSSAGVPYYWDAAGITAAANRVALLTGSSSVTVTYDKGPGTSTYTPASASEVALGDRVNIQVVSQYKPLFGIVPLKAFDISSVTTRTILKEVSIYGNSGSGGTPCSVNITWPQDNATFAVNETIGFVASTQPFTGTVTYDWTANPGGINMGSGQNLNYAFTSTGNYLVTVTACSPSDSHLVPITIIAANTPPLVVITSPADGSEWDEGAIPFAGTATDAEDVPSDISANLVWTLDGSTVIGDHIASFSDSSLFAGTHTIVASVNDSGTPPLSGSATTTIKVYALTLPVVTITAPSNGETFPTDTGITFTGSAIDRKGVDVSASLVWTLGSVNGTQIGGPAASINYSFSAAGAYTVYASVTDPAVGTGSAFVTFTVAEGDPPVVTISSPLNGASFMQGASISFSGMAYDPNSLDLTYLLQWYSNISGLIGSGGAFSLSNLPPGTHMIRAEVEDPVTHFTGRAWVTITVVANTAPVVTILSPLNNSSYIAGQPVVFQGSVTDDHDVNLSSSLAWSSTLLTQTTSLGTGSIITITNLSPGVHTITAQVSDSSGLQGTASITLNINPPVCPTASNLRFVCKNRPQCEKLVFDFTTTSPNLLQVEFIEVNWAGASQQYQVGSLSFAGGTPDPIPLGGNTGYTPVVLNGNPLWRGAFSGTGPYTRQLFIVFSKYPGCGDPGTWNVAVRFKYCQTSQGSTGTPINP